ncbi:DUF736 domain-containing protein [Sphingomonas sp. PWP1-2]|uniref:DUF736 domain-containing protein n=1 Tax=Sphingomonas sp. PWP1-2 TaxID=2804558 RepID=UPI003CFB379F
MPQIGLFTRTSDGFSGIVSTVSLEVELALLPADNFDADNAPDFRVHLGADGGGPEVGAAWCRTGERAGAYLSLMIDDPSFAGPIHANLFQSNDGNDTYHLVWTREPRRDGRA